LQEQQRVRERVAQRLERERQEEAQQGQREGIELKTEIDKTLRMEQIMNALKFEVLKEDGDKQAASGDDNSDDEDEEANAVANSLSAKILASERKGSKPECVICLQSYNAGQVLCSAQTDQCHHIFHEECAIGWLQESNECPLCRVDLLVTAELSVLRVAMMMAVRRAAVRLRAMKGSINRSMNESISQMMRTDRYVPRSPMTSGFLNTAFLIFYRCDHV